MKTLLLVGALLVTVSAPLLTLMAREFWIGSRVADRYSVDRIISRERGMEGGAIQGEIHGHVVALEDDQPFNGVGDVRADGPVRILVDGRDYSSPASAKIRLSRRDANRYWGFVYLMKLTDRETHTESLVVAQSLGAQGYRTISVAADGRVLEDRFGYAGRCSPPIRAALIRYVVPHPSGYCSDVLQGWPSLLYPVLYPWTSGALGLGCLAAGLAWRTRVGKERRRAAHLLR
jgi:hypothetical protein